MGNNHESPALAADWIQRNVVRAVEFVECIQPLVIEFDERASVKLVGAALGNDLHLGTGIAPLLGIVRSRGHYDLLDRFLVRGDDRGAAVAEAVDTHAV